MVSLSVLVTSVPPFAAYVTAQTPAEFTVNSLGSLTQLAQNLQPVAQQITAGDDALFSVNQGRFVRIVNRLAAQSTTIVFSTNQLQNIAPITASAEADAVSAALRTFTSAEQALMMTLIDKAGLASIVPLIGQRIVDVLDGLETALGGLESILINKVPSKAGAVEFDFKGLSQAVDTASKKYSGALKQKRSLKFARRDADTGA